ncbi:glutamate synthase large subunit [Thermoleophilia bacterium SCSIO 60948]|nr:glutamate synthase large subunit [Thermoleophilia bacterium SCSIO 60948]
MVRPRLREPRIAPSDADSGPGSRRARAARLGRLEGVRSPGANAAARRARGAVTIRRSYFRFASAFGPHRGVQPRLDTGPKLSPVPKPAACGTYLLPSADTRRGTARQRSGEATGPSRTAATTKRPRDEYSLKPKPVKPLHDPLSFRDACGVACMARLDGRSTHDVVERSLTALDRLEHRGAAGADETTGDGAGIMVELPYRLLSEKRGEFGIERELPERGRLALGMGFLRGSDADLERIERRVDELCAEFGQRVLGWREVPVVGDKAGRVAGESMPRIRQVLIEAGPDTEAGQDFERRLYLIRRNSEREMRSELAFPSFSSRTCVYKGMLTAPQLRDFYPDLTDPALETNFAIVHSRFSTNTNPSWELAQPFRMIAHNGEINTARGNMNWMRAREASMSSEALGEDLERCFPLIPEGTSDSAAFDRALELLVIGGRSTAHAKMMMIPQAYEGRPDVDADLTDFYRFHSALLEPWDGPAAVVSSDGRVLVATVDRNGLRPGRWVLSRDGWVGLSSEAGTFDVEPEKVERVGRLEPGRLFAVDLVDGELSVDGEAEHIVASKQPYGEWHDRSTLSLADLPEPKPRSSRVDPRKLRTRQLAFGYTQEDLRVLIAPLARDGKEPTGSMGNDAALAVFSEQRPSLFGYFKQRFAQVTNPAIDPVREELVMSLSTRIGARGNLLDEKPADAHQILIDHPVLTDRQLDRLRAVTERGLRARRIAAVWPVADGPEGMARALERIHAEAAEALDQGVSQIILSDRGVDSGLAPIPSLLSLASLHEALVRQGVRLRCSLIVESGEPREIHHIAALIGYGADAVNPYLMLESIGHLAGRGAIDGELGPDEGRDRAIQGICKGLMKVLSKMGISTISSYRGAQIFEAVGLDEELIAEHFTGTPSRIGGVGLETLAREALDRHARAYPEAHKLTLPQHVEAGALPVEHERLLPQGGLYQWRRDGERHMWEPATVASLQRATRSENGDGEESWEEFSHRVNDENSRQALLRGLLDFKLAETPTDLTDVEPSNEIVKRFSTGAMSLGALSPEAHETLAVAMNRLGGKSNSGEGGEDRRRNTTDPNGDQRRSRIRQVASGRFGVDIDYLQRADQIQIKIAQGAKPGEGGQLPGHKVDDYIAQLRFSTPGVELISPPPHHDIYSIEDLKQLIYDLRTANPRASVSVKLAAQAGVGTVASGVVKAGADHLVIAGFDGGTGASPQSSIQSAGVPWELGLAETQQALLAAELRDRVVVQSDGQMRTGRDVVIAAILGADEVGLSTAPLIATGCIMMRVCHLNTCPVGVATQDPVLRARFSGRPEHVTRFMLFVAEEARELIAKLGAKSYEEIVGRTELLEPLGVVDHWKARSVDLRPLLEVPEAGRDAARHFVKANPVPSEGGHFDRRILDEVRPAISDGADVRIERKVVNTDLTIGGLISSEIAREYGPDGLTEGSVELVLRGSAGQSFGAWLSPGVSIDLQGDVNDYAGKGLSGGTISVRPDDDVDYEATENVVAGNVALYGATGGRAFFRGLAGERFAVRNSGAWTVVEGIGDHGCEYMTGGRVVVLGAVGPNFAAGMSGGVAYVLDEHGSFERMVNHGMVDLEEIDESDAEDVRGLITEHLERTASPVAERLLGDWDAAMAKFVRVIPRGYREALAAKEQRAEAAA